MPWTARLVAIVALAAALGVLGIGRAARAATAHAAPTAAAGRECAGDYPASRNPTNPLDLTQAPGADPLTGAHFFVPGPAEGNAAGAIASLVGLDPATLSPSESWAQFHRELTTGSLHAKLAGDPALARKVALLSKIAAEPQTQRISSGSWGGTPDGIFKQTQKIFCQALQADPGTIPIFTTYFLHETLGGSPTPAQVRAYMPLFKARVNAMARATGRRPAVFLLELDAIGSSQGIARSGALPEWEAALRYEMDVMQALPHTVVYVEGGYSDSNSVAYTAKVLRAIGIHHIRGFFTNDTHDNWTIDEDRWASAIAARVGGTHFIVNTSSNGRGPKLNPHPSTQGVEDLCNPPGRGLGIRDTTHTGVRDADAYLWEHTPGNSSGCGGGPSGGTFWPQYAEGLAARANDRLGPSSPSRPYAMGPVATAASVQYCAQVPMVGGIPPWGFHTGDPITGATGSYARGHGNISLTANTVSGILCQVDRVRHAPDRLIVMSVEHHLVYHSHVARMWGYPGNIMVIDVRVTSSTDPRCAVGTRGRVTLFASYNGVRSDSVRFRFPRACRDHDHLYHGPQVNNQVPPR